MDVIEAGDDIERSVLLFCTQMTFDLILSPSDMCPRCAMGLSAVCDCGIS